MPHIRFNYRYRDYANYKQYGFVVFANPNELTLKSVEASISKHLRDDFQFLHTEWGVPDLHFEKTDWEDDHLYHEFVSLEEVSEGTDQAETIDTFLAKIEHAKKTFLNHIVCNEKQQP